jgi:mono/diheme cytochrome c family protein
VTITPRTGEHANPAARSTRTKALLLFGMVGMTLIVAACGRASDADILSAIGITPTPTQSPEQIATATAAVAAQQTAVAAAAASPGAGGAVAMGDITRGERTFNSNCVQCHTAGAAGGDITAPGGPASALTLDSLTILVREGTNHTPPGPYQTFQVSDRALGDILAYLIAESSS